MTVTTALYRRYRPDSFADVIGQEHVTEPLMTALRKNRVNHAYLFSGPRGCGKTTSARILARCLNCAEGPTDTPCGKCNSCVELARGGSGSLDVIEIDAASHGGVDDARDLRERATFAPVRDRYKIFIIDEAHMVTSAGFNALLKIVEEPPEHIKFIFATTEPDKVIGTIRSRTHHYPFRLVPPEPLMQYLELLCQQENVPVAPGVLSLVIRAGGGSVRDSLSVLDQLMAGAGPNGLDYELAVALLGYTHASLLDDVVEAIAASDSATVFRAVDRVIQTGHDPRRFVEDLLERFRDLIIVQAMPESAQAILRGMPADQIARMRSQANNLGAAELSRAADVTNTALTEMTGATSPRLHLELLCARILLPSSEQTERGIAARIDRVERRLNYGGGLPPAEAQTAAEVAAVLSPSAAPTVRAADQAVDQAVERPTSAASPAPAAPALVPPAPLPAEVAEAPAPGRSPSSGEPPREQLTPPRVSTTDWPVDESRQQSNRPTPEQAAQAPSQLPAQAPAARPVAQAPSAQPAADQDRTQSPAAPAQTPEPRQTPEPARAQASAPAPPPAPAQPSRPATGGADVEVIRRAWPEILQTLTKIKRSSWALVGANAQVAQFDGQLLTLAFSTDGLASAFSRADHAENLRQAIHKTIGIDCQITSVVGGNSSGSSEPNPKAPADPTPPVGGGASPVVSSAVDSAWGLAPATQSPAAPEAEKAVAAPALEAAPTQTVSAAQALASTAAPASSAAAAVSSPTAPTDPAADYSYSDDDWGPPRDEDAPPLDEEPPMDWEPAAPPGFTSAPTAGPATRSSASTAAPATASTQASSEKKSKAPEDPWSRAVEHAPGSWVVGSESNVGSAASGISADPEGQANSSSPATPSPVYEPAAAQIPIQAQASVPAPATAPAAEPARSAVALVQAAPAPPAAAPSPAPAPAAPAPAPAPAQGSTPATVPAPSGTGKQSLYQRLSNSPEAMAGREKAPARATVAPGSVVEDIPSADDETIEESGVFGRAAVERILGGKLLEERSLDSMRR
ncbi:DNA polymerase III subunit gamma and tau [Arthrobacter sp. FW306-2-2C-D06B]|uniref:DNA polymerase III subunit gamma and tau n=1 Tax=Arthrobacter sp. FW306-2-2C-D06B TaxID=2879618 RepID=UPI001F027722|nr:DNA polymerase III subunit gamma and tau [Arthrobacter sp. FW306-2-2C-D06B]UKA59132.1 DNA polymerase III subunit gamma and tau [Arthrobacter sp. FW306-2-2C-D06B]